MRRVVDAMRMEKLNLPDPGDAMQDPHFLDLAQRHNSLIRQRDAPMLAHLTQPPPALRGRKTDNLGLPGDFLLQQARALTKYYELGSYHPQSTERAESKSRDNCRHTIRKKTIADGPSRPSTADRQNCMNVLSEQLHFAPALAPLERPQNPNVEVLPAAQFSSLFRVTAPVLVQPPRVPTPEFQRASPAPIEPPLSVSPATTLIEMLGLPRPYVGGSLADSGECELPPVRSAEVSQQRHGPKCGQSRGTSSGLPPRCNDVQTRVALQEVQTRIALQAEVSLTLEHAELSNLALYLLDRFGSLQTAFERLDRRGCGQLTRGEFEEALRDCGYVGNSRLAFRALDPERFGHIALADIQGLRGLAGDAGDPPSEVGAAKWSICRRYDVRRHDIPATRTRWKLVDDLLTTSCSTASQSTKWQMSSTTSCQSRDGSLAKSTSGTATRRGANGRGGVGIQWRHSRRPGSEPLPAARAGRQPPEAAAGLTRGHTPSADRVGGVRRPNTST